MKTYQAAMIDEGSQYFERFRCAVKTALMVPKSAVPPRLRVSTFFAGRWARACQKDSRAKSARPMLSRTPSR